MAKPDTSKTQPTLDDIIDSAPIGRMHKTVFIICFIIAMLDGFDTQAIAFVAPVIAQEWGLEIDSFGAIFAAGLLGLTIGALVFGPVADRFGRKPVLLISTVIFGVFALLTVQADSFNSLFVYRLLTGIGLGGAMPNIIAITSEYFPKRVRTTAVTLMFTGFPFGAVLGGLAGGKLIEAHGWEAIFFVGGIAPLIFLPVILLLLPESIRFLVRQNAPVEKTKRILRAIRKGWEGDPSTLSADPADADKGMPVAQLFTNGRAVGTLLLWVVFFVNLLILYFLINWLPTVMHTAGMPLERAIIGIAMLNLGGVIGGFVLGRLVDKFGPVVVLASSYTLSALMVAMIGQSTQSVGMALGVTFVAGFLVIGSQFCANALAAQYYPTSVRSTGVGWALGIGRIGSIIGPLIWGLMIGAGYTVDTLLLASGLPALLAALAVILVGVRSTQKNNAAMTAA